ncbi:MAG: hypothetical protein JKY66_06935 [Spongiibacteraceae bacterium]|nr:hypothetical protein [Spongiibacteraceae bacterium]MBN4055210.1 hypothetical protein [bacterium AH-315-K03]
MEQLNRIRLALFVVVVACLSACCSEKTEDECPLTLDVVTTMETREYAGKLYTLVQRLTGWHEKTVVIQLFDKEPQLDACRRDLVKPVIEDSIESELPVVGFVINLKEGVFEIDYGKPGETESSGIQLHFKSVE